MTGQVARSDQRKQELAATEIRQTQLRKSGGPTSERQNTIPLESSSEARPPIVYEQFQIAHPIK